MRVLLLSQWKPSWGGVVTHVEKLMENSDHHFTVIGYPRMARIPLLRAGSYIFWGFFKALRESREESYSLIHAHYALPQGFLGVLLKRVLRLPLVLTLHGSDINVLASSRVARPLVKKVIGESDFICAVSSYLREEAVSLGADREKVEVVYGAPKVEELGNRSPQEGLILYVGSMEWQKGLDVLLKAFPRVRDVVPHARLEVVGGRGGFEALSTEGVSFEGYAPDLEEYYSRAEVVVIPSRQEGLSLVALEALALGIPVVATRVGGLGEILKGKALLVENENPRELARAIIRVLKERELRKKLGVKRGEFTGKALAGRMDSIYRRAVGEE